MMDHYRHALLKYRALKTFVRHLARTATLLPDGRVLVGGSNASGVLNSAELYDHKDDTIALVGSLSFARTPTSAAFLLDGTVLVAGGQDLQHTVYAYDQD